MAKFKTNEPRLSVAKLEQRCKSLALHMAEAIEMNPGDMFLKAEVTNERILVSLGGRKAERISRNKGHDHNVLSMCEIENDVFAWIGFRELWTKNVGEQLFTFNEGGFTTHIGKEGETRKPQIFRSEWSGIRSDSYHADIGQPHWQMDVLESFRIGEKLKEFKFGESSPQSEVKDFSSSEIGSTPDEIATRLTIERMHLASHAPWWIGSSQAVSSSPASVADLNNWVIGCLKYIRQEVGRCNLASVSL